jgi:ribbon-helix-helix CopG family protein
MTVTMYNEEMKTITITIPEELDKRATAEARRRGMSKSELIRQGLGSVLSPAPQGSGDDPWHSLAGFGADDISVRPGEIDDIIYG